MNVDTTDQQTSRDNLYGHCNILDSDDLRDYLILRNKFLSEIAKSPRGEKIEVFTNRLNEIRRYVVRNDGNDWKRSFATGIIFLGDSIAINIKQLINLLGKCKSSINGSLHQLGYVARPASKESDEELLNTVPFFSENRREIKKWTIRQKKQSRRRKSAKMSPANDVHVAPPVVLGQYESLEDSNCSCDYQNVGGNAEDILRTVGQSFPCPIKFRCKYLNILSNGSVSVS